MKQDERTHVEIADRRRRAHAILRAPPVAISMCGVNRFAQPVAHFGVGARRDGGLEQQGTQPVALR